MDLSRLRTNQLSNTAWTWYQSYLDALDAYDVERYAGFLAEDVTIAFNNDDPMRGRSTAEQGLGQFWGSISAMGFTLLHQPLNIYGTDDAFVLEALNHYDKPGSDRVTVHAAAFTDRAPDGTVTSIRLYQDVSPLYTTA